MSDKSGFSDAHGDIEYESIEQVLRRAFAPVDPPARLYSQFEDRLEQLSLGAAEDLSDWELAAMGDPRNWIKPATAVVVGGAAAGALVVLGLRQRRREDDRAATAIKALGGALGDVGRETARTVRDLGR